MRTLNEGLKAHLEGETTTLCRCWLIKRKDGVTLGFTDHDRDVRIAGTLCEGDTGMDASVTEEQLGFAIDQTEASGALSSDRITEEDIMAGLYDAATVSIYVVNWREPEEHVLERILHVGEIKREDGRFHMEMRGFLAKLDQTGGRHFVRRCQADLGDHDCGIDLGRSQYRGTGTVERVNSRLGIRVEGIGEFAKGWFRQGVLTWTSGRNAGSRIEIAEHTKVGSRATLQLWQPMALEIQVGDSFTVTAGCDKEPATCKAKFANFVNYRGFPHMPGENFAQGYAANQEVLDGGPIVTP